MERGLCDFVIGLLPLVETHGHHKTATVLACDGALTLPIDRRPIVLGGYPSQLPDAPAMRRRRDLPRSVPTSSPTTTGGAGNADSGRKPRRISWRARS